jgi:hypothetical protein
LAGTNAEFQIAAESGRSFLRNARDLDEQTRGQFQQQAKEARILSIQVPNTLVQELFLELAQEFDGLAR